MQGLGYKAERGEREKVKPVDRRWPMLRPPTMTPRCGATGRSPTPAAPVAAPAAPEAEIPAPRAWRP